LKKKTLLVSLLVLALVVNTFVLPATVSAAPGVEITKITGTVEVQKKGSTEWVKVEKTPHSIYEGDKVRTGKDSGAEIASDGIFPTKLKMSANSIFELQKNPKTGKWIALVLAGVIAMVCFGATATTILAPPVPVILLVTCIVLSAVCIVYAVGDLLCVSAFRETVNVQTLYENGSLIAQTNITGSLGLYPNGTAWANGQQVSVVLYDGTISEPIEVSLSPSEAMELYKFVYGEGGVGGIVEFPQIEEPGAAIPNSSEHNYGALAGIIAGAIAGVTVLISAAWYIRRRRTKAI